MPEAPRAVSSLALSLCAALACAGVDEEVGYPPAAPAPSALRDLPPGWTTVRPGGQTACSDGSPFSFVVRPGSVDRVLLEWSGGGACWDAATCAFAANLFSPSLDGLVGPWEVPPGSRPPGIYDHDNADNPFRDWHHVFIPYCTGDIHWGENVVDYGTARISHLGAVNTRAVLEWVYARVPAPEKVALVGCSAGGYGAILWAPYVRAHYGPGVAVSELADSAAGAITPDFFVEIRDAWRFERALPTFVPGLARVDDVRSLATLYAAIGAFYPDVPLGQYNTTYDEVQSFFFGALGGGDVSAWSAAMRAEVRDLGAVPSFRSIVAPGYSHCILNQPDLYEASFGGVRLVDWIRRRLDGLDVASFDCGAACGSPR